MRRYGGRNVATYVIIALMVVGLLSSIARNASQWIIPVVIFGLVFLLYRFPPSTWRYLAGRYRINGLFGSSSQANGRKSKRAKFRVIRGNKQDDDETPKYH
ncbi:hypothetical protein [Paenibacillus alkalitolerans]|uniref:hypothetical protein n=1 Tax=Paenibacillus alkalitolerans TaxID=2799335 RepID=UPI0018F2A73E|nr:hypothetical protein [Paenibacillus alkalitolerans]